MQRNTTKCPHCGNPFFRLTRETPLVSRSDGKTFHLALFSGPEPRSDSPSGLHRNQVTCNFRYKVTRTMREYDSSITVVFLVEATQTVLLRHIENAADKLSELIERGEEPVSTFTYYSDSLIAGFPK